MELPTPSFSYVYSHPTPSLHRVNDIASCGSHTHLASWSASARTRCKTLAAGPHPLAALRPTPAYHRRALILSSRTRDTCSLLESRPIHRGVVPAYSPPQLRRTPGSSRAPASAACLPGVRSGLILADGTLTACRPAQNLRSG